MSQVQAVKIKSINKISGKFNVVNLTVNKNHTFITELGIVTHNCDRASSRGILALQGIAEGKPVLIKKTGQLVRPAPGFNIIATGNTKGRGSLSGRYTSAMIVDEAFLERFPVDIEQNFPKKETLRSILESFLDKGKHPSLSPAKMEKAKVFVEELASWGEIINTSYEADAIDETLSVRRLVHILKTYTIFENELRAIRLGINRFDEVAREAFLDLYRKISKLDLTSKTLEQEEEEIHSSRDL